MSATSKLPQVAAAQVSLFATEIVRSFVLRPDQVTVEVLESNRTQTVLMLKVHPEDMEIILGHEGRILRALRTFLYAAAARNNLNIQLQVEATRPPGSASPSTPENS